MESPRNNIDDSLLAKYLDGSTTEQENAEVESWIAESSENRQLFDQFKEIWFKSQAAKYNPAINFDKKAAFRNVLDRINEGSDSEEQNQKLGKTFTLPSWFARVAAILIIGVCVYLIYQNFQPSDSEVLLTATNENTEIVLPDSSIINLNAGSQIKYSGDFTENRSLSLSGEAFFEVEKVKNQTFVVEANGLEVKVLGTSFYVIAHENDIFIEVGVKTGTVEVVQKSGKKSVVLEANEMAKYNKATQSFSLTEKYNNNKLFWKTAVLEFNGQPLDQVLSSLEKAYGKEIIFQQSELENCHFTGRFKNASLEEIIAQLQLSFNIEATMGEKVIISGKACEE
ncbi:DUF4974 domain-containing protein [Marivirga sp. S37H4]|uniref:DUF4974 domain-containing protein n=1 Tax=Marivirga aurantiaca TaxID=2802615 RepID=A0A934WYH6_9BACT|nr:FecR domain-containing protein [Marivirga aurantiaca]MBK6265508.1 DUF4974 domain-containing protein [Marivirga aurantiaca]